MFEVQVVAREAVKAVKPILDAVKDGEVKDQLKRASLSVLCRARHKTLYTDQATDYSRFSRGSDYSAYTITLSSEAVLERGIKPRSA